MSHTTAFIAELIRAVNEAKGLRRTRSVGFWITRLAQSVICADRLASLQPPPGPRARHSHGANWSMQQLGRQQPCDAATLLMGLGSRHGLQQTCALCRGRLTTKEPVRLCSCRHPANHKRGPLFGASFSARVSPSALRRPAPAPV